MRIRVYLLIAALWLGLLMVACGTFGDDFDDVKPLSDPGGATADDDLADASVDAGE